MWRLFKSRNPDVRIPFSPSEPTGRFVFVSYAHEDKRLVDPELRRLRSFGIHVWYDEGIDPGSEWAAAIADALKRAAACVVMITPNAAASMNVKNEIGAALNWKKLYAIHLTRTELPDDLQLQMVRVNAVMRWQMDEDTYARKLREALASYAEAEYQAPPVGPPVHVARTLTGHANAVTGVAFSRDERLLATASLDKTARLWDPVTGKHLRTLTGHTSYVNEVAFGPSRRLLATASWDNTARVWD